MKRHYLILPLVIISLSGCVSNDAQNYVKQASKTNQRTNTELLEQLLTQQNALAFQTTEPIRSEQLSDLVQIPQLNAFIKTALKNNPGLQQSLVALNIAYAQQGITAADRLPSLGAGFSGEATEGQDDVYLSDLTVSWELDLWQRLADSSNAAKKDILSAQANWQSAQGLITANIMRTWLGITLKQQLMNIEAQRLSVLENNEELVLERYRAGLGSLEELDNAKSTSATTRATLANYSEQLAESRRSLTLLSGQWSGESQQLTIADKFPDVLNPLHSMPEQDLARRPDLQAAFLSIEAESLRTDAAYKAMLPSISLSASLSDMATSPSEALLTSPLWSVLGQISAPLFQGGKLKAQAELAELNTEISYWNYQDTLLKAVNEVENALGQEQSLAQQQQHLSDALSSAQRSFTSYEEKYRQGLVDIFDLLTVQQQTFDLEAQLSQARYNRLINRINLGLALGLGATA